MRLWIKVTLGLVVTLAILLVGAVLLLSYAYRDRRPPIYHAVARGDTNELVRYLASGSNVNAEINLYPLSHTYYLGPPLFVAIRNGQTGALEFLLNSGANPNKPDSNGDTPIMHAIGRVNDDVPPETRSVLFALLLKAGADVNLRETSYGQTPLMEAAMVGKNDFVERLLAAGADINATNYDGSTALHVVGRHEDTARFLLRRGADASIRDTNGATAAENLLRLGYTNTFTVVTNWAGR